MKFAKWSARIIAAFTIIIGLLMYFGYGDLYPFTDPNYGFLDNLWRLIFPLMFVGLAIGWKFEKIGGYLTIFAILTRTVSSVIVQDGISIHLIIPFMAGLLFLVVAYSKDEP